MTFPFTLLLLIHACIMYKQTCIHFKQLSSRQVSPSSGVAGMVMCIILPLCSGQYVLLLNTKLSIFILHLCMHVGTHARTDARPHARTHAHKYALTHARTYECTYVRTHLNMYIPACM